MIGNKRAHLSLFLSLGVSFGSPAAVILQYHHVSETLPAVTSVSSKTFRQHLDYLQSNDYHVIHLHEVLSALQAEKPLPEKTIAITFDDGYSNNFDAAAPLLESYHFPYTIFVNPKLIDEQKSYVMTWDQLRTLAKQGATIASHSAQHDYLHDKLKDETDEQWRERIRADLNYAQARIKEEIGHDYPWVAFPYGEYNRALQELLIEMGLIGIGQQSGAINETTEWTAVPRYPASGIYADLETLSVKLNSSAFSLSKVSYEDTVTRTKTPQLTLTFKEKTFHQSQFACYVTGQDQAEVTWTSADTVQIQAKSPLKIGRSRYNCTAPVKGNSQRYHWYSQQWLIIE
ncbi:Carbohydrate Esterase Family 4 [Pseudoalteromonas luteoviolacea B = ATCC 29581]|nr:Carbohydrate Esterase Family 4 [Pseudoalteromonas luteoviolacea B = ATCC 29581]